MKTELEDKISHLVELCYKWELSKRMNMPCKGIEGAIIVVCEDIVKEGKSE